MLHFIFMVIFDVMNVEFYDVIMGLDVYVFYKRLFSFFLSFVSCASMDGWCMDWTVGGCMLWMNGWCLV